MYIYYLLFKVVYFVLQTLLGGFVFVCLWVTAVAVPFVRVAHALSPGAVAPPHPACFSGTRLRPRPWSDPAAPDRTLDASFLI